jgi:putative transposase
MPSGWDLHKADLLKLTVRTQAFLSSFGPIRRHFALKRHLIRASLHRKQLSERFAAWHRFTELTQNPSGF